MAFTLQRAGQINGAGDARALYLKIFLNEVITQFNEKYHLNDLHIIRQIGKGAKSAQFPVFGKASAGFFTPGGDVDGQAINTAEIEIFIDEMILSAVNVPDIDEMLAHFDFRAPYVEQMSQSIMRLEEDNLLKTLVRGATESSAVTDGNDGEQVTMPSTAAFANVTAAKLLAALSDAASVLDEKNVPDEDRYALLTPRDLRMIVDDKVAINKDYGGVGSYARGVVGEVHGIKLVKSNRLASLRGSDYDTNPTGSNNDYTADMTKTNSVVFHKTALGTVQRMGMTPDVYRKNNFVDQLSIRSLTGHEVLRPEAIVEIEISGS